jgi:rhodanese-related sulfurtransferase
MTRTRPAFWFSGKTPGGYVPASAKNWIVDTAWLAAHLNTPGLIVLDGSWHLPTANRDPKAEYLADHIPGAVFFDIDDLTDEKSHLPHMLPSTIKFSSRMKKMGIGDGMKVVVYDTQGLFSAARVWWTFRAMGHEDVAVLDGGLPKWKAEGRELEDGLPMKRFERHFTPLQNMGLIRDLSDIQEIVEGPLRRHRAGAPPWRARRPYPRLAQCPFHKCPQRRRHDEVARGAACHFQGCRYQPERTGGDHVRIGCDGEHSLACAGCHWPDECSRL